MDDMEGGSLIASDSLGNSEAASSQARPTPRVAWDTGRSSTQETLKKHSWAIFTYRINIQWGFLRPNKLLPMPTEKMLHFPQLHFTVIICSFPHFPKSDCFYFLIDFILDQSRLPSKENGRRSLQYFLLSLKRAVGKRDCFFYGLSKLQ